MKKNNLKSSYGWLGAILLMVIKNVAFGASVSALFCLFKWMGSLMSLFGAPTWIDFIGGGIGVFVFLFLLDMFSMIRYTVRCKRDPYYKELSCQMHITWKEYQGLKRIQQLAQTHPHEFRFFVDKEVDWELFPKEEYTTISCPKDGAGWIRIIPNPTVSSSYCYYIRFTGPKSCKKLAIDDLATNFMKKNMYLFK